jgi:hypothetical protein
MMNVTLWTQAQLITVDLGFEYLGAVECSRSSSAEDGTGSGVVARVGEETKVRGNDAEFHLALLDPSIWLSG